jgi:hypothetical protein
LRIGPGLQDRSSAQLPPSVFFANEYSLLVLGKMSNRHLR